MTLCATINRATRKRIPCWAERISSKGQSNAQIVGGKNFVRNRKHKLLYRNGFFKGLEKMYIKDSSMYNTRTCHKNNFLHSTTIFVRGLHETGLYDILRNFVESSKEEISGLMHSYCTIIVNNSYCTNV